MPAHDDHRDAHLMSLRLALGSIVAPKRPQYTRASSSMSGTASPALPYSHPATPLPTPTASGSQADSPSYIPRSRSGTPPGSTPLPVTQPAAMTASEPPIPSALTTSVHADAASSATSQASGGRANLIGTLQSKSAWDALIHGSWV